MIDVTSLGHLQAPSTLGQAPRCCVGAALPALGLGEPRSAGGALKVLRLELSQDAGKVVDVACGVSACSSFLEGGVMSATPSRVRRGQSCEFGGLRRGWGAGESPAGSSLPSRGSAGVLAASSGLRAGAVWLVGRFTFEPISSGASRPGWICSHSQKRTRITCLLTERPGPARCPCAAGAPTAHGPEGGGCRRHLRLSFRVWGPILLAQPGEAFPLGASALWRL